MLRLSFSVPMLPIAKGRARITRHGAYTPTRTIDAEKTVRDYAFHAMHPRKATRAAVALHVRFTFPIPPSWPTARRAAALEGRVPHLCKPDLDNLLKLVKDALNGVAYADDCQIVTEVTSKVYGGVARIEVELAEVVKEPTRGG